MKTAVIIFCMGFLLTSNYTIVNAQQRCKLESYTEVIRQQGRDPLDFCRQLLEKYDLLVFDDALHNAEEPFRFYTQLLRNKELQQKIKYVFIEVFSITSQPYIDRYLESAAKDSTQLLKVFQDDFSGYGWRYQTYLDLFSAIWEINRALPALEKIKIIPVDQPIYWEALHTRRDYDLFQQSLVGRDYFMYRNIVTALKDFSEGRKGIFLTNTRHAYKGIRNGKGKYYWNTATFLQQHFPGKSFSLRIHNVSLFIEGVKSAGAGRTSEGLDRVSYSWGLMENGIWDSAFAMAGKPVAIPLQDNCFGRAAYVGNHMLDAAQGQLMQDAYDGLIFLAPLRNLHFSARLDFIYTPAFKKELARRLLLLHDNDSAALYKKHDAKNMDELIDKVTRFEPRRKNNFLGE
ncbi:MAG TPA: hypothetical protein VFX58_17190 [Chitinophagaceae bacterium]|nr:hypothetical protein [Chitinophagaceae bacterium]